MLTQWANIDKWNVILVYCSSQTGGERRDYFCWTCPGRSAEFDDGLDMQLQLLSFHWMRSLVGSWALWYDWCERRRSTFYEEHIIQCHLAVILLNPGLNFFGSNLGSGKAWRRSSNNHLLLNKLPAFILPKLTVTYRNPSRLFLFWNTAELYACEDDLWPPHCYTMEPRNTQNCVLAVHILTVLYLEIPPRLKPTSLTG